VSAEIDGPEEGHLNHDPSQRHRPERT
jgi:hypothetical protein